MVNEANMVLLILTAVDLRFEFNRCELLGSGFRSFQKSHFGFCSAPNGSRRRKVETTKRPLNWKYIDYAKENHFNFFWLLLRPQTSILKSLNTFDFSWEFGNFERKTWDNQINDDFWKIRGKKMYFSIQIRILNSLHSVPIFKNKVQRQLRLISLKAWLTYSEF